MKLIDLNKQYQAYKEEIDLAIADVLQQGEFILGKPVGLLESELSQYVQSDYCITVSSGTDALVIAMMSLGIGPGDEVITTPFTWISTVETIARVGARPVLVDIDPQTYLMDLSQVKKLISSKTKAIIPVSLYGQMPDFDILNALEEQYSLTIIEDAAQSFGARQKDRMSCGVASIGCTSFFPSKPLGCYGDGGAIFTNDPRLAEKMQAIRVHGATQRNYHVYPGMNGRFDTIQAAILRVKLRHFNMELNRRQHIAQRYTELLGDIYTCPKIVSGNTSVYAQYVISVDNREAVVEKLQNRGIPTAIHYPRCVHMQPSFAHLGYAEGDFPNAEKAAASVLSLPMHSFLEEHEQDLVIDTLKECALLPL